VLLDVVWLDTWRRCLACIVIWYIHKIANKNVMISESVHLFIKTYTQTGASYMRCSSKNIDFVILNMDHTPK
jgi:hypothetical protein